MVADCLVSLSFDDGDTVLTQGDVEEMAKFYLIEDGEAVASQVDASGTEVEVGRMKKGDYFGERALITNEARAATVKAVGPLRVAAMDRYTNCSSELSVSVCVCVCV